MDGFVKPEVDLSGVWYVGVTHNLIYNVEPFHSHGFGWSPTAVLEDGTMIQQQQKKSWHSVWIRAVN